MPIVKHIVHRETGRHFYLGRKKSAIKMPHPIRLENYVNLAELPPAPDECDYTGNAAAPISQMYGNDQKGDCVEAGIGHLVGIFTSLFGGSAAIFSLPQIWAMYTRMTGGEFNINIPSTDQGTDPVMALHYWQHRGFVLSRHRILGWAVVNASNIPLCKAAIWLFCNMMEAMDLPDDWISPPPSADGFVLDIAGPPNPENGHFMVSAGYNANGPQCIMWSMKGSFTWPAVEEYGAASNGGDLYIALSQEVINRATGIAPSGFNAAQLLQDLRLLSGQSGTYPSV